METILGVIAIVSFAAFALQTIIGIAGIGDLDVDFDSGSGFFTVRNLIAFLLGFSGAGYLLLRRGYSEPLALAAGILFGSFLVASVFYGMKAVYLLQQRNVTESIDYVGLNGKVLIKIGAEGSRSGKVEFTINGRIEELPAVTDESSGLARGQEVIVIKRIDGKLLVRKKIY